MKTKLSIIVVYIFVISGQAVPTPTTNDPYAEDMKTRKQIAIDCVNQVHVDVKQIEKAMHSPNELPSDNKYKQFLSCSYKKQKFQSEKGEMLYDNISDFLTRFYNRSDLKVLDKCKGITGEDDGDTAYNSLKCILRCLKEINADSDKSSRR
ncbi:hypothetical protein NQ315_006896 [Exocentrus adspersus]|uniref:Uncharacterized protein n=1 Tax=Exocentrus adspersus TaxID=1586481 RepID=A0AAV8WC01_9CUCU|nr:hypothetical protein NQ315_006896 [Exocentrus adspersus]